jgi:hypothetical protein
VRVFPDVLCLIEPLYLALPKTSRRWLGLGIELSAILIRVSLPKSALVSAVDLPACLGAIPHDQTRHPPTRTILYLQAIL